MRSDNQNRGIKTKEGKQRGKRKRRADQGSLDRVKDDDMERNVRGYLGGKGAGREEEIENVRKNKCKELTYSIRHTSADPESIDSRRTREREHIQ